MLTVTENEKGRRTERVRALPTNPSPSCWHLSYAAPSDPVSQPSPQPDESRSQSPIPQPSPQPRESRSQSPVPQLSPQPRESRFQSPVPQPSPQPDESHSQTPVLQPSPQVERHSQPPVHRTLHQAADIRRRVCPHVATKTRIFILPCSDPGSPTAPGREDDPPAGSHEVVDSANASAAHSRDKGKEREPPPGAPSQTQHAEWEHSGQVSDAAPHIVPPKRKRRS